MQRARDGAATGAHEPTAGAVEAVVGRAARVLRRAAVVLGGVGLLFAVAVFVVVDRWPPARAAGTTQVAALVIGLIPAALAVLASRRVRLVPGVLADLRAMAADHRSVIDDRQLAAVQARFEDRQVVRGLVALARLLLHARAVVGGAVGDVAALPSLLVTTATAAAIVLLAAAAAATVAVVALVV